MTPPSFHHLVDEYLNARRGLGFGLETQEWFLRDFARHAERIGHSEPVTIELAVQWALSSRSTNPAQAARRLAIVQEFAPFREPATIAPPLVPLVAGPTLSPLVRILYGARSPTYTDGHKCPPFKRV